MRRSFAYLCWHHSAHTESRLRKGFLQKISGLFGGRSRHTAAPARNVAEHTKCDFPNPVNQIAS